MARGVRYGVALLSLLYVPGLFMAGLFMAGTAAAETIHLGAVIPLTGPAAVVGNQEMRGIQFAIDNANAKGGVAGNQVDVQFEDNQAKADQAVLAFNKLVDLQHIPMMFVGYSGPTLAMAPLATRKQVLLVNAGAQADKLSTASPYLVNTLPSTDDEVKVMVKYLAEQGKKKAAVLYENDAPGIGGRDDFVTQFPKSGGTIVAQEPVQFGQTDYRPALLKLAAAKPDVLYVVITAGMPSLVQQLHEMKPGFLIAGSTFMADPAAIADPASNGIVHTQVQIDAPPDLSAAFKAKYGADMDFFARQYYNAAQIMLTVLDRLVAEKKPITGKNIHDTLFQIRKFQGLIPMEFNSNTATVPIGINMMKDGKDVTLKQVTAQ
ncbi:MAG TPA: ABC transporter substrate-binding protein [Acetobacteraceae bacterium]|nr:ABC transporter substrate-binding protein [Acetobacteraceae bacterium]